MGAMACMEASDISVMNRALTGFPLESVIEKVQFSRLPGSNLSRKEEVLMSSFLSGAAVRMVAWAVVISPSLIVSRLIVANPPKESSEFEIDCFAAIVELYHFGFDQAVGCINGIEDIGIFEKSFLWEFLPFRLLRRSVRCGEAIIRQSGEAVCLYRCTARN